MPASDWTPERIARLKELYATGIPASAIARALGENVTRNAVIGKVNRLGLSRPKSEAKPAGNQGSNKSARMPAAGKRTEKRPAARVPAQRLPTARTKSPQAKPAAGKRPLQPPRRGSAAPTAAQKPKASAEEMRRRTEQPAVIDGTRRTARSSLAERLDAYTEFGDSATHPERVGLAGASLRTAGAPESPDHVPHEPSPEPVPLMVSLVELSERSCRWPIGDPEDQQFGFCGLPAAPGKPYCAGHALQAFQPLTSRRERDRIRGR